MRIGELAELAGMSTHAIRYYERVGLLSPAGRAKNRYRDYAPEAIDELGFIKKAQHLGLTLADIRTVLEISSGGDPPCDHVRSVVRDHLASVEVKLEELRALRATLRSTLAKLDAAPTASAGCRCAVIESASPARAPKRHRPTVGKRLPVVAPLRTRPVGARATDSTAPG